MKRDKNAEAYYQFALEQAGAEGIFHSAGQAAIGFISGIHELEPGNTKSGRDLIDMISKGGMTASQFMFKHDALYILVTSYKGEVHVYASRQAEMLLSIRPVFPDTKLNAQCQTMISSVIADWKQKGNNGNRAAA